jgi:hypothetical protein
MVVPNYTYLMLKMPGPRGVITIGGDLQQAHLCELENYDIMTTACQHRGLSSNTTSLRGWGAREGRTM